MIVTHDYAEVPARTREAAAPRHARPGGGLLLPASMVVSFLAASSAPIALWSRYASDWHGGPLVTTAAFAAYAAAVLVGLLTLGEISNHVGRTPVLLSALAAQSVALLLFATAGSYAPIFTGRVLQGVAAGAVLGTLGALMIEAHRAHGTLASAAAPGIGTGSGALIAALVVGLLPWPTRLIYLVLVGVFVVQAVAVLRTAASRRTAGRAGSPRSEVLRSLRPRVAVPRPARKAFAALAPLVFAVWALPGFFGSLGPALIRQLVHGPAVVLGGVALFGLAGVAAVATVALSGWTAARSIRAGVVALLVGLAALVGGVLTGSIPVFLLATALPGIGFGSTLQGVMRTVIPLSDPDERPGLLSAVYLISYAGLGLPAVLAGLLVGSGLPVTAVAVGYLAGLAVLVIAGAAALALSHRSDRSDGSDRGARAVVGESADASF